MSMNVRCHLVLENERVEVPLVQTASSDSYRIVYQDAAHTEKRAWQASAREYLATVARYFAPQGAVLPGRPQKGTRKGRDEHRDRIEAESSREVVKRERRAVGQAWRAAELGGGRLEFSVA
jgi:hypothetical protein